MPVCESERRFIAIHFWTPAGSDGKLRVWTEKTNESEKGKKMKLSKELGGVLRELYGSCPSSECFFHRNQKRRAAVFTELARHGLVTIAERGPQMPGLMIAKRINHEG